MANRIKLREDPVFFADYFYYDPNLGYQAALGREQNCSYYTNALIIKADPTKITDQEIEDLKKALSQALEQNKGK
ncbi:MAG TPA: hypothetical protein VGQ28_05295 [Thermoanaerobaculia bacterium]|jgi:hypothetical protein|nr:hypothetical protein [Thermoanaerobaculia bacterium]